MAIAVAVIVIASAALVGGAWWAISSVYRSRELLAARTKITPASIQQSVEWGDRCVVPLARLTHSLSRRELMRIALSKRYRISYYALTQSQRADFIEAFAISRLAAAEAGRKWSRECGDWRPAYFCFVPRLPGMPRGVVARLVIVYTAPSLPSGKAVFGVDVYSPVERPLSRSGADQSGPEPPS
ncbi:MAG TPA: hypothetical protein VM221_02015 [Armatimonadota bacterium]|nr:hypothetical protein [Armatimonadota bacterium]